MNGRMAPMGPLTARFSAATLLLLLACGGGEPSEIPGADGPEWTDLASQTTGRRTFLAFRTASVDSVLPGCDSEGACARVALTIPTFPEARPQLQDALHRHVVDLAELEVDPEEAPLDAELLQELSARLAHGFLQDYRDFVADFPDPSAGWFLERSVEVEAASPEFLTLGMREHWYTGGAHANGRVRYRTLDAASGAEFSLRELLRTGFEEPLRLAGERAFRVARDLGDMDDLGAEGFFESAAGRFSLNENFAPMVDGLAFHYDAYEIAAYAAGPTDLVIPWEEIADLILADGPLADFVGLSNRSLGAPQ